MKIDTGVELGREICRNRGRGEDGDRGEEVG